MVALIAIVAISLPPAHADRDISGQVEQAGEAVDAANAKVTKALKVLEGARSRLPQARAAKQGADASAATALKGAQIAASRVGVANQAVVTSLARQTRVQGDLQALSDQMDDVVRLLYQQGPLSEIDVLLGAQSPGDFTLRLASVDAITRSQTQVQKGLVKAQADLVMTGVELARLKADALKAKQGADAEVAKMAIAQQQARSAAAEIASLVKDRRGALAVAKRNKAAVANRFARLKAKQAKMAKQAAAAARRESARLAEQGDVSPTGGLGWPIDGGVVSAEVGPRVHPVYGYASCHTGTDIRGGTGTPIHAAAAGTVATISHGGPYGNATLVAHADGITTFYAHQTKILVNEGDHVNAGEVIGEVGETGWATGPHLHFEVRINGTAYDPMGWFGGEKIRISCQ